MFKPVHGVNGYLVASITALATAIYVDDDTAALLARRLPAGDHTYLLLRSGYDYEIVKAISQSGNILTVQREQDGTTALSFAVGTPIEFVLSDSAIAEILEQKVLEEITLAGEGIVTVTKTGVNQYTVSAPEIVITSESPNVLVGGTFPNFMLSSPLLVDCCD